MDFKTLSIIIFQNKREWNTIQDKDKEFLFLIDIWLKIILNKLIHLI
jgi:hypothetical protein